MDVLLIGATGKVGRHAMRAALDAGHKVRAFGRSVDSIELDKSALTLIKGDVISDEDVDRAMPEVDAVVLAFGAPLTPDTILEQPQLCELGTRNVVAAMHRHKVKRLICMTSIGAGDSEGHGRWFFRNVIEPVLLGRIIKDRTAQEAVVHNAELDQWVIVRPTELVDRDEPGEVRVILDLEREPEPETIARRDVGAFLARLIDDRTYDAQTILITN